MTNLQLLLSIGIPTLVVLVGIYQNNKNFAHLGARIEGVEKRLDGRIDGLANTLGARLDRIEADLRQFYASLGAHGEAIDILKKKANL